MTRTPILGVFVRTGPYTGQVEVRGNDGSEIIKVFPIKKRARGL